MFGETFQTAGLLSTRPLSVSVSVFDSNPQNRIDRGSCNISFPVVLDVCCAWCLWGREILFPFCLFRVSIRFTPTLNRTITQTERIKGHFVCLCVGGRWVCVPSPLMVAAHHHASCIQCIQRLQESQRGWWRGVCVQPRTQGDLKWDTMDRKYVALFVLNMS